MVRRSEDERLAEEGVRRQGQPPSLDVTRFTDGNPLGLDDPPSPISPKPWRMVGLFAATLMAMGMLATVLVVTAARDKKVSLLKIEERRLLESVTGRAKTLETWLEAQRNKGRRLTESQVFRLFIADLALHEATSPLPRSLQDQRPYFQQLMSDFARQSELVRVAVLRRDGAILLSSPGPALPVTELLRQREASDDLSQPLLSSIRRTDEGENRLVVDATIPIPQAQTEETSASLVLTLPIDKILDDVLSTNGADHSLETIALLQPEPDRAGLVQIAEDGLTLTTERPAKDLAPGMPLAFERRGDDLPVYSMGTSVKGLPWALYHALDARAVLAPVHHFVAIAAVLSAMAAIALTTAFLALMWRQQRNHHRDLVEIYKSHAQNVDRQRRFLQSITTSMDDWLTVSAPNGEIVYANPAFDAATATSKTLVPGSRWDDLVKRPSAVGNLHVDLTSLIDGDLFETVEIGGEHHIISSQVTNLLTEDGDSQGTVRVVRDHTDEVAERQKRLAAIGQTIDALVHAIELRDPFLLGHTRRLRCHAIAIGRHLGMADDDLSSLALAASLSQIGKIFIPDDVLIKPDRHTAEEESVMRNHVRHAVDILERIDFDLPVADILAHMHERLDGSGYPQGVLGDSIGMSARILGVADIFCARTAPRSYRDRISAGKALYHLANNERRYDLKVVAALAEIVGDEHGIDDDETIDRGLVDEAVWRERTPIDDRRVHEPA